MLYNYLKSAYRQLLRHQYFSFLNITGLALGFACSLLLLLFIFNESSYDNFHKKGERIVRVTMAYKLDDQISEASVTGSKVAPTFVRELPEVQSAVRFNKYPVIVKLEDKIFNEDHFLYADSTLFNIFSFNLKKGNPATALNSPNKVVITPATAQRYFGSTEVVGKTLIINDKKEFEITGIIEEAPLNSQIKYDFIGSFSSLSAHDNEQWWSANYYTYLLLNSAEAIPQLQKKIFEFMQSRSEETKMDGSNYLTYNLEPLREVHLHSSLSGMEPNMDIRYIYIFSAITLLILLIACINYMNLATARAVDRGTEVGVRKVLGAHRRQVFWQYINESFLNVFLAACLAWVLASAALPFFNEAVDQTYTLDTFITLSGLGTLLGVLILVGLISGAYPAMILSHFSPLKTLKSKFKTSSHGLTLRQGLVIFQFVISVVLIICSLVIYKQLNFIKTTALGYQKERVFSQTIDRKVVDKFETLKGLFMQYPNVENMTMGYANPTHIQWGDGIEMPDGRSLMVTANPVEINYLRTFNIELLAGHDFSRRDQLLASSDSAGAANIIINEKAAESMGWSPGEAIGKQVSFKGNATIIGVMKDFHYAPLHEEIGPLVFFVDDMYNQLIVKLSGRQVGETLSGLQTDWAEIAPHIPFNPSFLDQEYNAMYYNEQRMGSLFTFFTALAILLACMGLLGLSALMISHRTQEIGIRKVLGATAGTIVRELSTGFLKLVVVALIIAVPLAYFITNKWLESFIYRINMPWAVYVFAGGGILCLTILLLSTQTIRAATRNPADVIRHE